MKTTKVIGYVDENGEIHEGSIPISLGARLKSPYGLRWVQVSQDFVEELASRSDIAKETLRVFLILNARLDFENELRVSQIELAEKMNLHKQAVNRAFKQLEDLGIIIRGPKVGRSSSWKLNPNAGWKGKVTHLRAAQREHPHLELVK